MRQRFGYRDDLDVKALLKESSDLEALGVAFGFGGFSV